jgi:hypothetical protein
VNGKAGFSLERSFGGLKTRDDPKNGAGRRSKGAMPMLFSMARREINQASSLDRDIIPKVP